MRKMAAFGVIGGNSKYKLPAIYFTTFLCLTSTLEIGCDNKRSSLADDVTIPASQRVKTRDEIIDYLSKRPNKPKEKLDSGDIPTLISILQDKSQSMDARKYAIIALEDVGDESIFPILTQTLRDPVWEVRMQAMDALLYLNLERAVPILTQLVKDCDKDTKLELIGILNRGPKDKRVIPILAETIKDPDKFVKMVTIQAIGHIGDESGIPILSQTLKGPNLDLKLQSIDSLCRIGEESVPVLAELLIGPKKDYRPEIRSAVARAIGRTGEKKGISLSSEAVSVLKRVISGPSRDIDADVRASAAEALRNSIE